MILTYDPHLIDVEKTFKQFLPLLEEDPLGTQFHEKLKPMLTYRRPRNIKDIIVHTDVRPRKIQTKGCYKCGKRCSTCPRMEETETISSNSNGGYSNGYSYRIIQKFTCQSTFVIYLITCQKCGKQYVRRTSNTLNSRMISHRADIKKEMDTSIAKHYNSGAHNETDMIISVISGTFRDLNARLHHEEAWIKLLKTTEPRGLNIMNSTPEIRAANAMTIKVT